MAKEEASPQPGLSCWAKLLWLILILVGLYFLARLVGLNPVQERQREEIIERPHG